MKILMILAMLVSLSCGKNKSGNSSPINTHTSNYRTNSLQVSEPNEAISILNTAVRMNRLVEYNGVKFYLYNGQYLFTSIVINRFTYRIVQ